MTTTQTKPNPAQAPDARPVTAADCADMLTTEGSARFVSSIRHQYFGRNPDMLSALKEFVVACAGTQRREGHQKWLNKLGFEYTNSLA